MEKDLKALKQKSIVKSEEGMIVKKIGDIDFVAKIVNGVPPKELKGNAENVLKSIDKGIATLLSIVDQKVSIVTNVTKNISDKFNAVEIVKIGSEKVGGKGGGGRPDMAQAGGSQPEFSKEAIQEIIDYIESIHIKNKKLG